MNINNLKKEDFWRAIILYGLNQATYKIALGHSLMRFSQQGKTKVTMSELAEDFFEMYLKRVEKEKPQSFNEKRRSVMERIIDLYKLGKINRSTAVEQVEKNAFRNVISSFHTVYNQAVPVQFYQRDKDGLILTDHLFEVFSSQNHSILKEELDARWDLLEAAFEMRRNNSQLVNDIRRMYLVNGYKRTDITKNRPVLNGYQNNVCFYCGEVMNGDDVHVDHVIPRQLIHHDEVWNLVMSHGFCNEQKSDSLPSAIYIEKLIKRNEHFVESNHPIKEKLVAQLGNTPKKRRDYVLKVYNDAKIVLGYTWDGIRGYHPETDPFYRTYVRYLNKVD
ncbi:HNH endonuclease [Thermoactinomyces sp. CICC 10523]|uniref:HNH endonuclease n=1 Tax=Thermoactinomyces sp. CICC 10523 TaxID=2767428 RepID=UPI0018DB6B5C|nr:HNH endonuclease domain-containing protein [Thermoactinomyces sp. CICC 10523]MBH8599326.1 HNH endonuclease [Thermoactinomyces sp. CICC 10523]